jgi:DNA-binding Lrp family transcriptional regulator
MDIESLVSNRNNPNKKKLISEGAKVMAGMMLNGYHNTKDNVCFPGIETIAERMGISPRQVDYYIRELREAGYITRLQTTIKERCLTWFEWNKINERKQITNKILNRAAVKGMDGKLINSKWNDEQKHEETELDRKFQDLAKPEESDGVVRTFRQARTNFQDNVVRTFRQDSYELLGKDNDLKVRANNRSITIEKDEQEKKNNRTVKRPAVAVDSFDNFSDEVQVSDQDIDEWNKSMTKRY